jgi:hypothetical protein
LGVLERAIVGSESAYDLELSKRGRPGRKPARRDVQEGNVMWKRDVQENVVMWKRDVDDWAV